jgi:hypothetical protein
MIFEALKYLQDELRQDALLNENDSLKLGNIALLEQADSDLKEKVVLTLVNQEEEKTLKNGAFYTQQGDTITKKNPTLHLNLYLLISCTDSSYEKAVAKVSRVIAFFQRKYVFTPAGASPGVLFPDGIEKLIVDLFSMNFEQINHLWGVLGGKYQPSVLYKVRMVAIQNSDLGEVEVIKEIKTNENPF